MFSVIKQVTDLREIMTEAGVQFDRRYMARCPFHDDLSPSLSVKNGRFMCFACGEAGDCFDFIERYYCVNRKDALRFLGARVGIDSGQPVIPEVRKKIDVARSKREARLRFRDWIGDERSRVAERVRYLSEEGDIIGPESLGTNWAKRIYDELAKLEGRDEILWSHDEEAVLELYEESIISGQ